MNNKGVFYGKKILLITEDENVHQFVQDSVLPHNAIFYHHADPKTAIAQSVIKNPDLIIYDDRMPLYQGAKILSFIRRAKPRMKILLLADTGVPLRSIDVTAQGASFTITRDSSREQIYNAIKHCLAVASVPRVESLVSQEV